MVDLSLTIAITAINLKGLNTAIKNKYYHVRLGGGEMTQLDVVCKKCTLKKIA